jgi:hypothetical protein
VEKHTFSSKSTFHTEFACCWISILKCEFAAGAILCGMSKWAETPKPTNSPVVEPTVWCPGDGGSCDRDDGGQVFGDRVMGLEVMDEVSPVRGCLFTEGTMLGVLLEVLFPGHGGIGGTLGEKVEVAVSGNWLTKNIHCLGEEVKVTKSGNWVTKNIHFLGEEVEIQSLVIG